MIKCAKINYLNGHGIPISNNSMSEKLLFLMFWCVEGVTLWWNA